MCVCVCTAEDERFKFCAHLKGAAYDAERYRKDKRRRINEERKDATRFTKEKKFTLGKGCNTVHV